MTALTQVNLAAAGGQASSALTAMLEARSVALVGASARPGSLGTRMIEEVARSPSRPRTYLVNPRYADIGGVPCLPDLAAVPEPVDLALLAVPDHALEQQLSAAARSQARSAVIFGNAFDPPGRTGLRSRLAAIAGQAGMAVCGAGCMGFVNIARGLRAIGYVEPDPLPSGPVALVTHSGSVFSALLRTRRGFGFSLAVSSGQELVTTAADYARYALEVAETKVLALVLEAIRDAPGLRAVLAGALAADVPVVLLSVGASQAGQALVSAHSGALAAADGAWEALAGAYGLHRVRDLAELADTLELFAAGRRAGHGTGPEIGIATVHDSGLERAHTADLAAEVGVPFAAITPQTHARLAAVLDPGLAPANPLDVWGTGRDTEPLFAECLSALAADPAVAAVALAVDLVPEFDGDESYPRAALAAAAATAKPVAVLAGLPAAVDQVAAARLRAAGVPVLEGTRTGLLALRHLLDHAVRPASPPAWPPAPDPRRGPLPTNGPELFDLLREYGIRAVRTEAAASREAALAAADAMGYPVVLKTGEPGIAHKSDVGGVRLGLAGPAAAGAAYDDLAARLGPRVLVSETAAPGTELALGVVRDPALGPLLVIGAGGVLVEILAERAVLLAPVTRSAALAALRRLRIAPVLAGSRGQPGADLGAVADAITGLSRLACDLGDALEALDINPLICTPSAALAVDALLIPRLPAPPPPRPPRPLALARSMIVASFRCYVPRTGHDHGLACPPERYDHCGWGGAQPMGLMRHGRRRRSTLLAPAVALAVLTVALAGCGSSGSAGSSGPAASSSPAAAGASARRPPPRRPRPPRSSASSSRSIPATRPGPSPPRPAAAASPPRSPPSAATRSRPRTSTPRSTSHSSPGTPPRRRPSAPRSWPRTARGWPRGRRCATRPSTPAAPSTGSAPRPACSTRATPGSTRSRGSPRRRPGSRAPTAPTRTGCPGTPHRKAPASARSTPRATRPAGRSSPG